MTTRRPCPPAPGPLEDYAQQFDPLLSSLAQRRGLRDYLQGLTLVCLAFSFCWHAGQAASAPAEVPAPPGATTGSAAVAGQASARGARQRLDPDRNRRVGGRRRVMATGASSGARVAGPVGVAAALLAWMVGQPAAPAVAAGA